MDKYTKPVKYATGGMDPYQWFDVYYNMNKERVGK
jgi:hypothetical protein